MVPAGWPPYGLPPNYTPHYEEHLEQGPSPPVTLVNPFGIPASQQESTQLNTGEVTANIGGQTVPTKTRVVVHSRMIGKGPQEGPMIHSPSQGASHGAEEARKKGSEPLKEEAVLDLGMLQTYT